MNGWYIYNETCKKRIKTLLLVLFLFCSNKSFDKFIIYLICTIFFLFFYQSYDPSAIKDEKAFRIKESKAKNLGRSMVGVVLGMQCGIGYAIYSNQRFIKYFLCHSYPTAVPNTYHNKQYYNNQATILTLIIFSLSFIYYTKSRTDNIVKKYAVIDDFYDFWNILKFLAIFVLPIIIAVGLDAYKHSCP